MQPTTEVVDIKFQQTLLTGSLTIFNEDVSNPEMLLAPELPNLPGMNLPGMNLPGMNLPE